MERKCKNCKKFFSCVYQGRFNGNGCEHYFFAKKHDCVVIHLLCHPTNFSIIGFADTYDEGHKIVKAHSRYGSKNHKFFICDNTPSSTAFDVINDIKDYSLLRICENVAFGLSRAEYHMLKHRYVKSKFCFDNTFKQISDACYILENY